jgi:hypothetical protein
MKASAADLRFVNRERRVRPANFRSIGGTRIKVFLASLIFPNS